MGYNGGYEPIKIRRSYLFLGIVMRIPGYVCHMLWRLKSCLNGPALITWVTRPGWPSTRECWWTNGLREETVLCFCSSGPAVAGPGFSLLWAGPRLGQTCRGVRYLVVTVCFLRRLWIPLQAQRGRGAAAYHNKITWFGNYLGKKCAARIKPGATRGAGGGALLISCTAQTVRCYVYCRQYFARVG